MSNHSSIGTDRGLIYAVVLAAALCITMAGCGGETQNKPNDFFTSGDREADQRADQRMAKDQQLKDAKSSGGAQSAGTDAKKSLYDRLGGDAGITAIVEDFVPRAMADPRVNWDRKDVKKGGWGFSRGRSVERKESAGEVQRLKKCLSEFIALSTGGPSHYEGREMKSAHAGLHIANSEFDATLGDLKASLDKLQVPVKEQKELLAIIETTRPQIVEER